MNAVLQRRGDRSGYEDALDLSSWDLACALLERQFGPNWREVPVEAIRRLTERERARRAAERTAA